MADNYYVASNRFQPSRVIVFGLLSERTFQISDGCISIVNIGGSVDSIPYGDLNHFYVEVVTCG